MVVTVVEFQSPPPPTYPSSHPFPIFYFTKTNAKWETHLAGFPLLQRATIKMAALWKCVCAARTPIPKHPTLRPPKIHPQHPLPTPPRTFVTARMSISGALDQWRRQCSGK